MPERPRDVFASVATYTALSVATASDLVRRACQRLIEPYIDPQTVELNVSWCRANTTRQQRSAYAATDWAKVDQAGPLAWLLINAWQANKLETTQSPAVAAVAVHFSADPQRASVIECSINQRVWDGPVPRTVQEQAVAWATATFEAVQGIVGYLTLDYVTANVYGSMSPYESTVALSYPWASLAFREHVRGYYWGNLLHAEHVAALGGPAALAAAPVVHRQPLANAGYYLQLTDDLNAIDRGKLAQLKAFVAPLLPHGYPTTPQYLQGLPPFTL